MVKQYADVIIDISHDKVDRPFQYRIPPELAGEVSGSSCACAFRERKSG